MGGRLSPRRIPTASGRSSWTPSRMVGVLRVVLVQIDQVHEPDIEGCGRAPLHRLSGLGRRPLTGSITRHGAARRRLATRFR